MLLELVQSVHILIPSFFYICFFFLHPPCVALINEKLESLICTPLPQPTPPPPPTPPHLLSVSRCGKSMSSDSPPPPLVLIREECSGSSGSRVLSFPLTTVRPDSTLIALTPRHIPVQSLVTEFGYKRRAKGQNKLIFVPLIQNVLKLLTHICNDEARLEARSADTLNRMFQITNHRCFVIFFFNIFLCSALRTLKAL